MIKAGICIATYKRPKMLDELLYRIHHLDLEKNPEVIIEIFIVDNDEKGSAQTVVNKWKRQLKWQLFYAIETRRGIPFARNRLVDLSKHNDFIAFIDDDELPHNDWLDNLLTVQKKFEADIVAGVVNPRFGSTPPVWIRKIKKFNPAFCPTGAILKTCATNNVLIKRDIIDGLKSPFEEELALQGADDTLFFMKLFHQKGARIIWANSAIVEEKVPDSRLSAYWNVMRAYRTGNGLSLCDRYLYPKRKSWLFMRLLKGIGRVGYGILMLYSSIFRKELYLVPSLCNIFHGFGTFAGILNIQYNEYETIHGK